MVESTYNNWLYNIATILWLPYLCLRRGSHKNVYCDFGRNDSCRRHVTWDSGKQKSYLPTYSSLKIPKLQRWTVSTLGVQEQRRKLSFVYSDYSRPLQHKLVFDQSEICTCRFLNMTYLFRHYWRYLWSYWTTFIVDCFWDESHE